MDVESWKIFLEEWISVLSDFDEKSFVKHLESLTKKLITYKEGSKNYIDAQSKVQKELENFLRYYLYYRNEFKG